MEIESTSRIQVIQERIQNHQNNQPDLKQAKFNEKTQSDTLFQATQNPLIMRNLYIIIDANKSSKVNDFKPNRLGLVLKYLPQFITQFLEANPLSQIGIGVALQYECKHLLDFTSQAINIEQYLNTIKSINQPGFSLASCLQTALNVFSQTQLNTVATILFITSSPYTDDKIGITEQINQSIDAAIRINVISFSGVVNIMKELTISTQGSYFSPLSENDFQQQLLSFIIPGKVDQSKQINQLVKIGFPTKIITQQPTLCSCHLNIIYNYYKCPRCYAKLCNPPLMCPVCSIWIVLPYQILKSDRKSGLQVFEPVFDGKPLNCSGCSKLTDVHAQCSQCTNNYCYDCDILIHSLRVCPGCS